MGELKFHKCGNNMFRIGDYTYFTSHLLMSQDYKGLTEKLINTNLTTNIQKDRCLVGEDNEVLKGENK
jgi:hypothetical protein